jgi:DUF4097 and DUF4098 domain-containing protein YvlB
MTKRILALTMALAGVLAADDWAGRAKEDFRQTFNQGGGGRLELTGFNGRVEITGWDQNTVEVAGTKHAKESSTLQEMKVEAMQEGNTVRVRVTRPDRSNWSCNCGVNFTIKVPRRTELGMVKSSNGGIRIENLEGGANLETSNGGIRLAQIRGKVDARTSNGGVNVADVEGGIQVRTSNGGVTLERLKGPVQITTSNGSIRGTVGDTLTSDAIRLSTSNGTIEMRVENTRNNDLYASTSNGSIIIRMPAGAGARVDATTSRHESIQTDFDVQVRGTLSKGRLEGTIGSGGPLLQLNTSNGSIRLLKL